MANELTSTKDSWPRPPGISASNASLRSEEQDVSKGPVGVKLEEALDRTGMGRNQGLKRAKGQEAVESDTNRNSHSSVTSQTHHRTSVNVVPAELRTTLTELRSSATVPDSLSAIYTKVVQDTVASDTISAPQLPPPDVQHIQSPRTVMDAPRAEYLSPPFAMYHTPMDRYLAQEDTDFGGDQEKINGEWRKLRILRSHALKLRNQSRVKRQELKRRELTNQKTDSDFMKCVRERRLSPSDFPMAKMDLELESVYQSMQDARDDFGPVVDEYTRLEDQIDDVEFELAMLEGRLYNTRANNYPVVHLDGSLQETVAAPSTTDHSLLGLSSDTEELQEQFHPLQAEYLSCLGDLDLAKENLQLLRQERQRILDMKESRARVNMELAEHDQHYLDAFAKDEEDLLAELGEIEVVVEAKKAQCIESGVDITEDIYASSPDDPIEEETYSMHPQGTYDRTRGHLHETHDRLPLILPKGVDSKADLARNNLEAVILNLAEMDKGDQIKRWMIYRLRTSALEVEFLVRTFLQVLDLVDLSSWQTDLSNWQFSVLFYWDEDGANKPAQEFSGPRTHDTTIPDQAIHYSSTRTGLHGKGDRPLADETFGFEAIRKIQSAPSSSVNLHEFSKQNFSKNTVSEEHPGNSF